MAWWEQLPNTPNFEKRMSEGCRRIAMGAGVAPSRFVWLTDQYGDLLAFHPNRRFRVRNGYGDWNFAPLLFLDGHVTYEYITPTVLTTQTYTFRFE
jgi:prepilin-type processing-associated H-X9-DG protein